ncbi:hypothetical protein FRC06_005197 [Ceratobasidium sp. 370]|nr:hypothetical protein FRC06_005197 [Ceratobasidium sp. 370]
MAQFNFQQFTQCMQVVAEQIFGQLDQLRGLPQQVAAMQEQLGGLPQQVAAMQRQLGAVQREVRAVQREVRAVPQQLEELEHRLVDKMQYYERLAHARVLNASAIQSNTPLHPLPLPNGDDIPVEEFPANVHAFRALNGRQLTALLNHYQLGHHRAREVRIRVLAEYFGIQL